MSAASLPPANGDLSRDRDEPREGRLTDFPLAVKSAAGPERDLTNFPLGVKSAPACGLTHSPLGVKPLDEAAATHPPSMIADLTRPLWPAPPPDPPQPPPPNFSASPEYARHAQLEQIHREAWACELEDGVQHVNPENASPAPVPQVKPLSESHARCRTGIRGRTVVDDVRKQSMLTLLGVGFSLRMTAAYVGVSHQTVANVLSGDPDFAENVRQARERAKFFPLNCILRECGRSWKAATWLLEYIERQQDAERSDADKHVERVRAKALALIERDLAQKMRKKAAQDGHQPWLTQEQEELRTPAEASANDQRPGSKDQ